MNYERLEGTHQGQECQPETATAGEPAASLETYLRTPIQSRPKHEGTRGQGQPGRPHAFHRFSDTEEGAQSRRATRTTRNKETCQLTHPRSGSVKLPKTRGTRMGRPQAKVEPLITTEAPGVTRPSKFYD